MSIEVFNIIALIHSFLERTVLRLWKHATPLPRQHVISEKQSRSQSYSNILRRMPADAWDSHMHVTSSDYSKYPLIATAAYKPSAHTIQDAKRFESTIGISNVVFVQPSIYGNNNSCLLDALKALGPRRGRGVVGIDPDKVTQEELSAWHELGVRGVRLNLKSVNAKLTSTQLEDKLRQYARIVKPLGWVLELFIEMESLPVIDAISEDLGVRICFAHFGAPKLPPMEKRTHPINPYELAGFQSLINLLQKPDVWVKISAAYRLDEDPEFRGIEAVALELLKKAPSRCVFASDWPHTRFDGFDVQPFVDRCLQWTEASGTTKAVFVDSARDLWDVK